MNLGPRVKITTVVAVFLTSVLIGTFFHLPHVFGSGNVTVVDEGMFIVSETFPSNTTFLDLHAGHRGEIFKVTASGVNATSLTFTVTQDYGRSNATVIRVQNTTLRGSGSWTVYLDLGSSVISIPFYVDTKWSAQ